MPTKSRIPIRALLLALVAVCASAVPASNQSGTSRLYYLYEDNQGSPWCGGGSCNAGWCCRMEPVYVSIESSGSNVDPEGL
jgi:hypothetical protein